MERSDVQLVYILKKIAPMSDDTAYEIVESWGLLEPGLYHSIIIPKTYKIKLIGNRICHTIYTSGGALKTNKQLP